MKKLLIIGASILQLPAIKKAKEMGLEVAMADYDPKAVGIPFADRYFNASTIDVDAICKVAQEYRPDGIMTLATDMPMRSVAAATALLGLPGISMDTAIKATDKGEMIKAFEAHGVESPWFRVIKDGEDLKAVKRDFTYPCVMKPTDNAGSRGVTLLRSEEDLEDAYAYSRRQSRGGEVIVEEFLQGSEVSVEVMVVDGEPHVLAVTDKLTTGAPHFVEMGHSQPSQLPDSDVERIKDLAVRAVRAVGINCGPAHVEIMNTKEGPKMIELGARMGGDCITTHLVPLSTGIDMVRATIDVSLGNKPDIKPKWDKGSAIRFFDAPKGKLVAVDGFDLAKQMQGIEEIVWVKQVGETISEVLSSIDRMGYIIAQGNTALEAIALCDKAKWKIKIRLQ